jgi:hypothetical protein
MHIGRRAAYLWLGHFYIKKLISLFWRIRVLAALRQEGLCAQSFVANWARVSTQNSYTYLYMYKPHRYRLVPNEMAADVIENLFPKVKSNANNDLLVKTTCMVMVMSFMPI